MSDFEIIRPVWKAPAGVEAAVTTRIGGISRAPYHDWNLASRVADDTAAVAENRRRLGERLHLPSVPGWLRQVHGKRVVLLEAGSRDDAEPPEADAAVTRTRGTVCAVLTADCLPVLLACDDGTCVAAAHAGWRGLAAGVIESTIDAIGAAPGELIAWLGPAIGADAYETDRTVRDVFVTHDSAAAEAFTPNRNGRWQTDLYMLARQRLTAHGVERVYGGGFCTHSDARRFFSYRRDGECGRMASLIWIRG